MSEWIKRVLQLLLGAWLLWKALAGMQGDFSWFAWLALAGGALFLIVAVEAMIEMAAIRMRWRHG